MRILMIAAAIAFHVAVCVSPAGAAEARQDTLWERAVSIVQEGGQWLPGLMVIGIRETDKHGEPKDDNFNETWYRNKPGKDGEVVCEQVKIIRDGVDVTEEVMAESQDIEGDAKVEGKEDDETVSVSFGSDSYSPFDSTAQQDLKVRTTGDLEVIRGKPCAVYEFEGSGEEQEVVSGTAWLEQGTGLPVRVRYTKDPLPKDMKKMWTTIDYDPTPDSLAVVNKASVQITAGSLFFKKHIRFTMTLSEYWKKPGELRD